MGVSISVCMHYLITESKTAFHNIMHNIPAHTLPECSCVVVACLFTVFHGDVVMQRNAIIWTVIISAG